jgi:spermidine/putrescine transport system substrate-binding protein
MKSESVLTAIAARRFSRRILLRKGAALAAVSATSGLAMPFVRNAAAATLELRWLGWQEYNVAEFTAAFEKEYNVKVSAGFFDGNSEAYNKLRSGGTADFDLVMADGFWPRLYASQGLVQAVSYDRLTNLKYVFPSFLPPNYMLLREEKGENMVAAPNCWGGYGITINKKKVAEEGSDSIAVMVDPAYGGHLSTSARYEENIALMGILAAHNLGTKDGERPNGKPFNPYVLTDPELDEVKRLLIVQKPLLVSYWNDNDTLERLLRSEVVWASPEWSGLYRRIYFDELDGKSTVSLKHVLLPKEGGLGWVDTWGITSGVKDSEKLELAHNWINFRLRKENMAYVATKVGWSPTVDVRDMVPERYVEGLFLNRTESVKDLYQFDAPSSPEKWEHVWAEVEAA